MKKNPLKAEFYYLLSGLIKIKTSKPLLMIIPNSPSLCRENFKDNVNDIRTSSTGVQEEAFLRI